MNRDDIKNFILEWNYRNPVDRWWREKHKVAFNSPIHRDSCFIDQLIEFEEDKMFAQQSKVEEYEPNIGNWLKPQVQSEEDWINSSREELKEIEELNGQNG